VYFAGEAKAILAVRPELRTIDPRGLGDFVSCGCVLENRTLFNGLHVLPGASKWTLRDGTIERQAAYFRAAEWERQSGLDRSRYVDELRDVVARSLPRYFNGPQPIGISLTGGLDSRIIMARRPRGATLHCYTFAGMFRESQDVRIGREVAEACGQRHRVIRVDEAFLTRFPAYAERTVHLSDGCADVSRAPDLFINALAREIAPVRLTGNFGSEVLRRVVAFKPLPLLPGLYAAEFLRHVRQAEATYADLRRSHPLSFIVFQQVPWHHHGLLSLEESQLTQRSPYLDNDLVQTAFRAPASAWAATRACLQLIADADPGLLRIPTDRGIRAGGVSDWPRHLLREVEFKAEYKGDYGMPQWLAGIDGRLSSLHPERLVLGRHKFLHFRVWYRDVLADHVRSVLLDPRTLALPFLEPKTVEAVVRDHVAGRRNYTVEIHRLLTLELVHRLFIRGDAAAFAQATEP
jgi:asparagine synthase (glutamine-hydrolysing)